MMRKHPAKAQQIMHSLVQQVIWPCSVRTPARTHLGLQEPHITHSGPAIHELQHVLAEGLATRVPERIHENLVVPGILQGMTGKRIRIGVVLDQANRTKTRMAQLWV